MSRAGSLIGALLRQRCPGCRLEPIFRTRTAMPASCPRCGYVFEREPGYFVGAMYFSYALAAPACALLTLALLRVFRGRPEYWAYGGALLLLALLSPWLFRFSRILWIYFDHLLQRRGT
ncbi:MAG TPA: DUF983 domain-containing protein [Candidatus Polarisedimenticolia bacterium]|nr:DUF983 domain-containing protein [Candidatus Polarisedimenticolia bacterium]